jgi:hypothetical protein
MFHVAMPFAANADAIGAVARIEPNLAMKQPP